MVRLDLDLLTVGSLEEIVDKAREVIKDLMPERLLFIYSDENTPATNLRLIDDSDVRCVQEDAVKRQCEMAYLLYDEEGIAESVRALHFFKQLPEEHTAEIPPVLPPQPPLEVAQIQPEPDITSKIFQLELPFALALNKDSVPRVSLKKHDFTLLEESSVLEPEYVASGSALSKYWKILVTGQPWEHASVVPTQGGMQGCRFSVVREVDTVNIHLQMDVPDSGCYLGFRIAIDGELCGPVMWIEARVRAEASIEQQLLELGALESDLDKLKQLYEIGLTELPKLLKVWRKARTHGMDVVANLYWGEYAD